MLSEELPLTPEEIGRLIKASGYNQKELAEQLKLSEATVSKWVNGLGTPSRDNVDKLRALKPKPDHIRDWNTYVAEAKARVITNRLPPLPPELANPAPAVDLEAFAGSVAAKLRDVVAEAVKATVPTAQEVAAEVKATIPTAREVAAEVKATTTKPADEETVAALVMRHVGPVMKFVKVSVAITVSAVVLGMAVIVVLSCRTAAPPPASGHTATSVAGDAARWSQWSYWWPGASRTPPGVEANMGERKVVNLMPHQGLSGQALAPCRGLATTLYGACWIEIAYTAPCPPDSFQEGEKCYVPVLAYPKEPIGEAAQHGPLG